MMLKNHMWAAVVIALLAATSSLCAAEDPVGWWQLDDATWKDASGHGNDLASKGKTPPAIVEAGKTKAASFTSSKGQYLAASAAKDLAVGTGDFTLLAWVKVNDPARRCGILGGQPSDYGDSNYGFYQRDFGYHFIINGPHEGETWPFYIIRPMRPGWCHLAGVRAGDRMAFYIDGKLRAERDGAAKIDPNRKGGAFVIGTGGRKNNELFDGEIAQVKLFKTALSDEAIAAEYARLADAFGPQSGEMVLYDEGFEAYPVAAKEIKGMSGHPEMPDVAVTDNAHYTSERSLHAVYHPELKKSHTLRLSPKFPTSPECTVTASVRVQFEDVNEPRNRKWMYPYIRMNIYDAAGKALPCVPIVHKVTTTDSETSADDNWMEFKTEFTPPEGAASLELLMFMYEEQGVRGTVYLDDLKIVQKF